MKNLLKIGFVSIVSISCGSEPQNNSQTVQHIGELRAIMHGGAIQSRIELDTMALEGLYGLGAMDSLSGEILVLNGQVYRSEVEEEYLLVKADKRTSATLFVFSWVDSWDTLVAKDFYRADDLLAEISAGQGLIEPFPFILEGNPSALDYHVLNFDPKTMDIGNHKEGSFKGLIQNEPVQILGFYSLNAKGIYTHHDSNVHMHFISQDRSIMGHVDLLDGENQEFKLLIPGK